MKDLKISKELMSEVLNYEVDTVLGINKNEIDYTCCRDENEGYIDISINLYEFAFKCKEWAISKGYIIKSKPYDYNEDTTFSGGYFWITRIEDGHCPNCGANRSEIQAIIDGCEWILRKNNKSLYLDIGGNK